MRWTVSLLLTFVLVTASCSRNPAVDATPPGAVDAGEEDAREPAGACWGAVCFTAYESGIRLTDGGWADGDGGVFLSGRSGRYLVVSHFDGSKWSFVGEPLLVESADPSFGLSAWLDANAPDDLWVIAPAGPRHWDGARWTQHEAPVENPIQLLAIAPSDVWLLGRTNAARWNGSSWDAVALPAGAGYARALFATGEGFVWLAASGTFVRIGNDWRPAVSPPSSLVWVGSNGAQFDLHEGNLRYRHEGIETSIGVSSEFLHSAAETPDGDVVFLLANELSYSLVRWSGVRFSRTLLGVIAPRINRQGPNFSDGTLLADADGIWLFDQWGTLRRQDVNGWRELQTANLAAYSIHGDFRVDEVGHIFRWDGASWTLEYRDFTKMFWDVRHGEDAAWAVGPRNDILRREDGKWVPLPGVEPVPLFAQWSDVALIGEKAWIANFAGGDILHWNGAGWEMEVVSGTIDELAAAAGTIWATSHSADGDRLFRRGESGWSDGLDIPNGGSASALYADEGGRAWVTSGNTLLRSEGSTWEAVLELDPGTKLQGIAGTSDGSIWVGAGDAVLQIAPERGAPVRHPVPGRTGVVRGAAGDGALWLSTELGLARWMPPE